jgi:uncharacterized protein (TIGR02996 family)
MEDEAFLRAIRDEPGNEAIRLVYADWLDERNDPRGEFLRLCDRLQNKATVPREPGPDTIRRLNELLAAIDPGWVASVAMPPGPWDAIESLEARYDDPTFLGRWRNFVLACGEAIRPDLPAEARDWLDAAASFDRGERSATELADLYAVARAFDSDRASSDPWPVQCRLTVVMTALGVRFSGFDGVDASRWHEGAWHFLNCGESAGLPGSLLMRFLRWHFGALLEEQRPPGGITAG